MAKEKKYMTARRMIDELDIRTLPDGKKRIISIKFCTLEGRLHDFPQVYVTGIHGQNLKQMRYRGIQPCDCKGNPEEHVFPVKITNILELDGHVIDWDNGYTLNQ